MAINTVKGSIAGPVEGIVGPVPQEQANPGGLPAGGTTGQPLIKSSNADYDVEFNTLQVAGGGTGIITYTLGDILYSSAANTLNKLSGNTTTNKEYLSQTGDGTNSAAPAWSTISGSDITGAALTKTDDTNVTLTLGGSPTTSLLRATSITAGWTGQLALTRGGTNASLVASNGGIFYSTSSAGAILPGTATARQMLQSGASTTPAWSTTTWPATTTAGRVLVSATANTITDTSTPTLGASGTLGSITFGNATSGLVTLQPVSGALGTVTASLPANTGTIAETNFAQTWSAVQTFQLAAGSVPIVISATSGDGIYQNWTGATHNLQIGETNTGGLVKTTTAGQIDFGTTNTTRFTLSAAGGFYSNGVTGTDKGVGTVNSAGIYDNGNRVAVSASSPLSLNSSTGALSITGAALTKTDDTNVTLTLGGSPTTALVNAASLTLGWSGTLATSRGGTNVSSASDVSTTFIGRAIGTGVSGSTNNSSSGSGAYVAMTPTISIPANYIVSGRMLRFTMLFRINTGAAAPSLSYKLTLGGTDVVAVGASVPANGLTNLTFGVQFLVMGLAAPSASSNVEGGNVANANLFANTVLFNSVTQPVALATNGALTAQVATQWSAAGTGTNTVQLMAFSIESIN